jgi:beta-lactamase class D
MHKIALALIVVVFFSSCSTNNVTEDDSLKQYFDSAGVKGCFALFDNGQGRFTIYNLARYRDSAYPPGATYDILASLVAFQSGVIKDNKVIMLTGDSAGVKKKDVTMTQAFQTPYLENDMVFQKVKDSVGIDSLRKWSDSLHYGNQALDKDSVAFYDAALKIPADQQLGLIKKLYFGQLPFYGHIQELVRDMMITESNSSYKLCYKTGRVLYKDHVLGWVMGWVEENKHPYFFVTNFESPDPRADVYGIGTHLVKQILPTLGFFQGKK